MKLIELFESTENQDSIDALVKSVASTASESFIRESKTPFYRMATIPARATALDDQNGAYLVPTRKDRKPMDSSDEFHEYADKFFLDNFGWKARSQAVFASHDLENISVTYPHNLNQPYMFFPTDPWEALWAPKIFDFYDVAVGNLNSHPKLKLYYDKAKEADPSNPREKFIDLFGTKLYKKGMPTTQGNEVMFKTEASVLVSLDYLEQLGLTPAKFLKLLKNENI